MSDLFLLSEHRIRRIERYFPLSHGFHGLMTGVISGIIFVIRNGLRWRRQQRFHLRSRWNATGGAMHRLRTGHTRRCVTGLSAGASSACSTASSGLWRAKLVNQIDS